MDKQSLLDKLQIEIKAAAPYQAAVDDMSRALKALEFAKTKEDTAKAVSALASAANYARGQFRPWFPEESHPVRSLMDSLDWLAQGRLLYAVCAAQRVHETMPRHIAQEARQVLTVLLPIAGELKPSEPPRNGRQVAEAVYGDGGAV